MPLTKLQFRPGVNKETTSYTNEGGWFESDKVRFRFGVPEKIGGWRKNSSKSFLGTCRALHNFVALDGSVYLGVGTFQKYSAWSISTTDSLSMGVPYILPNKLCYPEMVGKEYPLLYSGKDEFLQKINGALDDDGSVEKAKTYLKTKIKEFPWASRVPQWFNGWDFLQPQKFDMIGSKSESYDKIVDFIHKKKSVTKKQILDYLGWGVRISFSPYRNRLRIEPTIKFTKNRYEVKR